jgi:hypothetical protein
MRTRGRALDQGEAKYRRAPGDEGDLNPDVRRVQADVTCFVFGVDETRPCCDRVFFVRGE